jgi:hypothetical protein
MSPTALPASDAALIAADLLDVLPDTAVIMRRTTAADGFGGTTATYTSHATLPARSVPIKFTAQDVVVDERFFNVQLYRITFAAGSDVQVTDRIAIDGLTLSVEGIHDPQSIQIQHIVICTRAAV